MSARAMDKPLADRKRSLRPPATSPALALTRPPRVGRSRGSSSCQRLRTARSSLFLSAYSAHPLCTLRFPPGANRSGNGSRNPQPQPQRRSVTATATGAASAAASASSSVIICALCGQSFVHDRSSIAGQIRAIGIPIGSPADPLAHAHGRRAGPRRHSLSRAPDSSGRPRLHTARRFLSAYSAHPLRTLRFPSVEENR